MPDIAMQTEVATSPEDTYRALTTSDGVAGWWTDRSSVAGAVGGVDRFHFPGAPMSWDMRVEQAEPGKLLAWHCLGGPPQWVGTDVRWTLQPIEAGTLVLLDHEGFAEVDAMFRIVTLGWAKVVLRLNDYLATGTPNPIFTH
jgi:uncharacterized protein YndB with AHSA1/START domain